MRISIFGLGYIGCVSVGGLAEIGHTVIGFDIDESKVTTVNRGQPTIVEKDLDGLFARNRSKITATACANTAIENSELSFLCVNTPGKADGSLDLSQILRATEMIARAVKAKNRDHRIIIRSTVPPGTSEIISDLVKDVLGLEAGTKVEIVNNPEFLREGTAVDDFFKPGQIVFGLPSTLRDSPSAWITELYDGVEGDLKIVSCRAAETIKYINNAWHALKVVFGNEVGRICHSNSVDAFEVMDLFCSDTKLNLSSYYLRPGFAFGGPCLTKDLRGCVQLGTSRGLSLPLLESVEISNDAHLNEAFEMIMKLKPRKVGFLGISFKPGTDDLRYSSKLKLAQLLLAKGVDIQVHDKNVSAAIANGLHREQIENMLGIIKNRIEVDLERLIAGSDLIVFAHNEPHYNNLDKILRADQLFVELTKFRKSVLSKRIGLLWD